MVKQMTDHESAPPENPSTRKAGLTLASLYPDKVQAPTCIGPIFIRKLNSGDWKLLPTDKSDGLGAQALKLLCSREEDKRSFDALADDDFAVLSEADIHALASLASAHNGWGGITTNEALPELSDQVATARQRKLDSDKEAMQALRKTIKSDYGFLNSTALSQLQDQMADLSELRNNANLFNAFKQSEEISAAARKAFVTDTSLHQVDVLRKGFKMPDFEDTPLGIATADSVRAAEQTAQKVNDLVTIVAGLNATIVSEVLPAWFAQVSAGQESSDKAVRQAAKSLWWTKWAVIASVVVTMGATLWQITVAKNMDRENGAQQKQMELLLRQQLVGQQRQIDQQAAEAQALRQSIASLKTAPPLAGSKNKPRR